MHVFKILSFNPIFEKFNDVKAHVAMKLCDRIISFFSDSLNCMVIF